MRHQPCPSRRATRRAASRATRRHESRAPPSPKTARPSSMTGSEPMVHPVATMHCGSSKRAGQVVVMRARKGERGRRARRRAGRGERGEAGPVVRMVCGGEAGLWSETEQQGQLFPSPCAPAQ